MTVAGNLVSYWQQEILLQTERSERMEARERLYEKRRRREEEYKTEAYRGGDAVHTDLNLNHSLRPYHLRKVLIEF